MDAPLPPPLPPPKPRLWTALVTPGIGIFVSIFVAVIVQVVALAVMGELRLSHGTIDIFGGTQRMLNQPWGPAALILPGQLTMLATVLAGAILSPQRAAPRLGFTRSLLPWWTLPLLLAGTFFAGGVGGLATEAIFKDPGPSMRMIFDMMQRAQGGALAALGVMLCVLPPLSEETLFRGYLQRRLLQRWSPAAAIALSSLYFVIAHFDPVHVLAVIPLGIWLGVVAWRCGSIWPSMLCHAAQNTFALWITRHSDPLQNGMSPGQLAALAVAGVLTIGAVVVMRRHPVPGRTRLPSALDPAIAAAAQSSESRL